MAYSRNKKEEVKEEVKEEKKESEELGALWERKSKSGTIYFIGKLTSGEKIVAFLNTKASAKNKQPDLRIYFQEEIDV